MSWRVEPAPVAQRELRRLPAPARRRLAGPIKELSRNARPVDLANWCTCNSTGYAAMSRNRIAGDGAGALEAAARSAAGDLRESSADQRGARQAAPAQTPRVAGAHFRALSGKWRDAPSSPAPAAQHSQADADPCLGVRPEPDHAPVVRLRHTPWSRERALAPTRFRSPSPPAHLPSPAEDDSNPHIDPFGSAVSHRHRPRWPVFRHGLLVLVDFFPQSGIPSKEGDVAGGHRSEAGRPQGSAGGEQVPGVDGVVERPAARVEGTRDE